MNNRRYLHFISLGYFCSVALELERIGLRDSSYPFDWLISDFSGVMVCIETDFIDFLNRDFLFQNEKERNWYKNTKYGIEFLHDFDKYKSLDKQLGIVKKKYDRRIKRFYHSVSEPTLFIRYISDENTDSRGNSMELQYIECNYGHIIGVLKSFNPDNDIIFIANVGVESAMIPIYHVEKDPDDKVARKPLEKNDSLYSLLMGMNIESRDNNIKMYEKKNKHKNALTVRFRLRLVGAIKRFFLKEYVHDKIY